MNIDDRYTPIDKPLENLGKFKADLVYEGYYWYSDEKEPKIVKKTKVDFKSIFNQPRKFIVEGHLYNTEQQLSYQIKNIDGEYHVAAIDVKGLVDAKNDLVKKQPYHAHDIKSYSKYTMLEAWMEQPLYANGMVEKGTAVEGLTTLVPAWSAFIGFED